MLDYCFSKFAMIYSLYFVPHFLIWKKKKTPLYYVYKSKDISRRINHSYKIPNNKLNIRVSYS